MSNLNPMELLLKLKNGNPQEVAEQIIRNNFPNDPYMQNLLQLGQRGDLNSLQQIAQNILGPQGKNFNYEMQNLLAMVQNM